MHPVSMGGVTPNPPVTGETEESQCERLFTFFYAYLGFPRLCEDLLASQVDLIPEERAFKFIKRLLTSRSDYFSYVDDVLKLLKHFKIEKSEYKREIAEIFTCKAKCFKQPSFYDKFEQFGITEEADRLQFAHTVLASGNDAAILFLAKKLDKLKLSNVSDRLQIARRIANRKTPFEDDFLGWFIPISVVIRGMASFDLPEEVRVQFAWEFLGKAEPKNWRVLGSAFDSIAPSSDEERVAFARTLVAEKSGCGLRALMNHVEKFELPADEVARIQRVILEQISLETVLALAENFEKFSFSAEEKVQVVDRILYHGDQTALLQLIKNIEAFGLPDEHKVRVAMCAATKKLQLTLRTLAENIDKFPLTPEQRLYIANQIASKDSNDYWVQNIEKFQLQECLDEEGKLHVVETIIDTSNSRDFRHLMEHFEQFALSEEKSRLEAAQRIAGKIDRLGLYSFPEMHTHFNLSEDNLLTVLNRIAMRGDREMLEILAIHMNQFALTKESSLSKRLQLALTITRNGNETAVFHLINNIKEFHLGQIEPQGRVDYGNPLEVFKWFGMGPQILDVLPEVYPEEVYEALSEQVALVKKVLEKTNGEQRTLVASQLIAMIVYLMEKLNRGEVEKAGVKANASYLNALLLYRNPENRETIFTWAVRYLGERIHLDVRNKYARIPALLLIPFKKEAPAIVEQMNRATRFFKNPRNRNALISLLMNLTFENAFRGDELLSLMTLVFQIKGRDKRFRSIQVINDLLKFDQSGRVKSLRSVDDIDQICERIFCDFFEIETIENFMEKYEATFGKFRQKEALLTWGSTIKKSDIDERGAVMAAIKGYFLSVLDGTFKGKRYDTVHLQTVFEGREELRENWIRGETIKAEELAPMEGATEEGAAQDLDFNAFFQEKIIDHKHLGENQEERFPVLIKGLRESIEVRKELIADLSKKIDALKEQLQASEKKKALGRSLQQLAFERAALDLSTKTVAKAEIEEALSSLPITLVKDTQFSDDIKTLKAVEGKNLRSSSLTVVDTDDPNDLLLMGTEITGSCQSVHTNASTNKCLVGYLVDGKNRMIAVKDYDGKLLGRCVLRLLWDGEKPVLFREVFYVNHQNAYVRKLLEEMSLRRAKAMGLVLLAHGEGELYLRTVESLGGPAPFEYVDAQTSTGEHKIRNGVYTLARPCVVA